MPSPTFDPIPSWIDEQKIDFSKLDPHFRPYFQKEKDCYKKAIIHNGRDSVMGRPVPEPTWIRDSDPENKRIIID
jgi:hypothetical protein